LPTTCTAEMPDENLNHAITLTTNQEVITLTKPAAGMTPNEFISLLDQGIGHLHSNEEWIERDRKTCTTRQVFLQFDRNGNGYLDATEFEKAIDSSGIVLNSKEKVILMMMADEDSNRQISYG
jgi:Ca2+-binding EF-hand superfamily protein